MNQESGIRNVKLGLIGLILASCFLLLASTVSAQEPTPYNLLAPLPLEDAGGDLTRTTTAGPYIEGIFRLTIAIAGVLAVVMLMYGGIKYMSTDAFTGKEEAKEVISNALWGLGLAIGAWVILYTINPNLVGTINLSIERQNITETQLTTNSGAGLILPGPSLGGSWQDDDSTRSDIEQSGNIYVNKPACTSIGQRNCTSVYEISPNIIDELKYVEERCNCGITITGGTEYWLHGNGSTEIDLNPTAHKPGGNVVDLSQYTGISNYIRSAGVRTTVSGCATGSEKYIINGATYVYENDGENTHWHVCF